LLAAAGLTTVLVAGYAVVHADGQLPASDSKGHSNMRSFAPAEWQDHFGDGTADFLRLDSPADRAAFRNWFALISEFQALRPPSQIPSEVTDCSALIRYSYRNALRRHDGAWVRETGIVPPSALPAIEKYEYPYTPLGADIFRVQPGPWRPGDEKSGAFAEFADANTLRSFNTYFVSRDVSAARRGDILFFRQVEQDSPFHSMIFLGRSQWITDGPQAASDVLVYDTGPVGNEPGEMRRLTMKDLLNFPSPRWRPLAGNSNFLGVYRWNILRGDS
jgi:uncharacterized protein YfaT (DUF1175 family)